MIIMMSCLSCMTSEPYFTLEATYPWSLNYNILKEQN